MCRMARMMRTLPLLLLAFAACQSKPEKLPEEQMTAVVHKEYARFRPVTMAVLKSDAPAAEMRTRSRMVLYDQLIHKRRYSPIALVVVDARTNSKGVFEPGSDIDCDATVQLTVSKWRRLRGHDAYLCNASLVMMHNTGVELYRCELKNGIIQGGADIDYADASRQIVDKLIQTLPSLPPLPQ
jgi:hypothetical protein